MLIQFSQTLQNNLSSIRKKQKQKTTTKNYKQTIKKQKQNKNLKDARMVNLSNYVAFQSSRCTFWYGSIIFVLFNHS
jgi:hypothetical protein